MLNSELNYLACAVLADLEDVLFKNKPTVSTRTIHDDEDKGVLLDVHVECTSSQGLSFKRKILEEIVDADNKPVDARVLKGFAWCDKELQRIVMFSVANVMQREGCDVYFSIGNIRVTQPDFNLESVIYTVDLELGVENKK